MTLRKTWAVGFRRRNERTEEGHTGITDVLISHVSAANLLRLGASLFGGIRCTLFTDGEHNGVPVDR